MQQTKIAKMNIDRIQYRNKKLETKANGMKTGAMTTRETSRITSIDKRAMFTPREKRDLVMASPRIVKIDLKFKNGIKANPQQVNSPTLCQSELTPRNQKLIGKLVSVWHTYDQVNGWVDFCSFKDLFSKFKQVIQNETTKGKQFDQLTD